MDSLYTPASSPPPSASPHFPAEFMCSPEKRRTDGGLEPEQSDGPDPSGTAIGGLPPVPARLTRLPRRRLPLSTWLVVFLLPYALASTFGVIFFWKLRRDNMHHTHVLESLPDQGLYEDYLDGKRRVNILPVTKAAEKPPLQQHVSPLEANETPPINLGQTRRIGSLAITPKEVFRQRLRYGYKQGQTMVVGDEALVLRLEVRNEGSLIFRPDDETFNRAYVDESRLPIYTFLEIGNQRFYGAIADPTTERLTFPLCPALTPDSTGQIFVTAMFSADGKMTAVSQINSTQQPLIWRVHLRRGKEEVALASGRRRSVWLTAVVPVQFRVQDVKISDALSD